MEYLPQEMILDGIVLFICVIFSAIFSSSETAITSLGPLKTKHLIDGAGNRYSSLLQFWLDHPGRVITTILIFNNVFNILASALATKVAIEYSKDYGVGIATGFTTLVILIFGEVIPKSFAKANAERLARTALGIVRFFYILTWPLVVVLSDFAAWIIKAGGGQDNSLKPSITREEIEFFINEGESEGVIKKLKKDMINSVFEFDETLVKEIMTPRRDCVAVEKSAPYDEVIKATIRTGFSRIPIYEESIDSVVGVVFAKDLLRIASNGNSEGMHYIAEIMREAYYVPESKPIMDVFRDLKRTKNHMAVVIDEHGGTDGIVTMEDILEEIVGEIQDEFDVEEAKILEIEPYVFDVAGSVSIDEFCEHFEIDDDVVGEMEHGSDTIAGLVTHLLGDIPKVSEKTKLHNVAIEVTEVEKMRIKRLRVTRIVKS